MSTIHVIDLAAVVYSSGKVFDGLDTGRVDTENFLRSGDTTGVGSRRDLELLRDLRSAAQFIIDRSENPETVQAVDADFVMELNAQMTRSASIEPGKLRRAEQNIGVNTVHGRHEPPAITEEELATLVEESLQGESHEENAARLFLAIAEAQPFMDGNKRTGIFAANAVLLQHQTGTLLTVPVDDDDPTVSRTFSVLLSRAYIFDEHEPVLKLLVERGIKQAPKAILNWQWGERMTWSIPLAEKSAKRENLKRTLEAPMSSDPADPDGPSL